MEKNAIIFRNLFWMFFWILAKTKLPTPPFLPKHYWTEHNLCCVQEQSKTRFHWPSPKTRRRLRAERRDLDVKSFVDDWQYSTMHPWCVIDFYQFTNPYSLYEVDNEHIPSELEDLTDWSFRLITNWNWVAKQVALLIRHDWKKITDAVNN